MPHTLETIFAEWKALETASAAMDSGPEWNRTYDAMCTLEAEMRSHPARSLREAAMKLEPWLLNTDRDPNATGVIEDMRRHLFPHERVSQVCPGFAYCARTATDLDPAAPMVSTSRDT